jgi:hypothetical protein
MKKKIILLILAYFILVPLSLADQLSDQCTSSEAYSSDGIDFFLDQAVKDGREDCINALLTNFNFNTVGLTQDSIPRLAAREQIFILRSALKERKVWKKIEKGSEAIVFSDRMFSRYIQLFKDLGIEVTEKQLLSESGRIEILKTLDTHRGAQALPTPPSKDEQVSQPQGSTTPRDQIASPRVQHQAPTKPNEKPASSTPWSIIVGAAMAALGVLWLFLKGRK